jgi:ADP-ribose 1''-phosphate phosphatase
MIYRKANLFKAAEPGAILLHSCNASGAWGAGIALQFKKKYPQAYKEYSTWCEKGPEELVGSYLKFKDKEVTIACLFTSAGYGDKKDSEELIVKNTQKSIIAFLHSLPYRAVVNSPKINAGLFKIPWSTTEKIIKHCLLDRPDITWVVYEI